MDGHAETAHQRHQSPPRADDPTIDLTGGEARVTTRRATEPALAGPLPATASASGTRRISAVIGAEQVRDLHRERPLYDAVAFSTLWVAAIALAVAIGSSGFGVVWALAFVAQGFLLQVFGYFAHDAFLHRRVGGSQWSRLGGLACNAVLFLPFTDYVHLHGVHHRMANTVDDSEEYKRDFNRRWVKLTLLTAIGTKLSWSGAFRNTERPAWAPDYSAEEERHLRQENRVVVLWLLAVIVLAFLFPRIVLIGYILPLVLVTPIASTIRVVLEHADVNLDNPLHIATAYRTGPISGLVFLYGAGDCHLVHHLYPGIPFYNMPRALKLIRPILRSEGVAERRSLLGLLYGWMVLNKAHGTDWRQSQP